MSKITKPPKQRSRIPKKLTREKNPELPKTRLRGQQKEEKQNIPKDDIDEKEKDETVYVNTSINEIFAESELVQYFTNKLDKDIELTISIPVIPEIQLTKFIISVGDKEIISKVLPKEIGKENISDTKSSDNNGILSTFNGAYSTYNINVGNVAPKEKVKLISIFNQLITSQDMSYEFSFMGNYPYFINGGKKKIEPKNMKAKFILKTNSKITRLISPFVDELAKKTIDYNITYNNDYTQGTIEFNKQIEHEEIKAKNFKPIKKIRPAISASQNEKRAKIIENLHQNENSTMENINIINQGFPGLQNRKKPLNYFCLLFRTEKMYIPTLYCQYDPEKKETAYCLNYMLSSKNLKNIPVPEKPDQDNNISYYSKYQENLINETPGLFIFLVDQSGSMRGNSINIIKKALSLFIQSLPEKSYFQLIGFGKSFHKYNESPVEYKKENVKNILSIINDLQANMGEPNISGPLKDIFENKNNDYDKIPLSKNVIILAYGHDNNRDSCIDLISRNSNRFRIHSIGIGDDFDKVLIERSAQVGKGTSLFVEDINKINEVVIDTLNKCLRPYLVDLSFSFNNTSIKNPVIINEPINNFIYQDEIVSYSFILGQKNELNIKKSDQHIHIEIKAKDPINEIKEEKDLTSPENIIMLKKGDNLSKIIIGLGLKYNKSLLESKEKEIKLAEKYQLLSKNTALFGEISKNCISRENELIKVNINKERQKTSNKDGRAIFPPFEKTSGVKVTGEVRMIKSAMPKTLINIKDKASNISKNANNIIKTGKKEVNNTYMKKPSFVQKEDGTIRLLDEFNDMLMSQDIIEGFWDENKDTKFIKDNIKKEKYEKVVQYIQSKNISNDFSKVLYTILVIYYIQKEKAITINEYKLVINKGKKFLVSKGINYDEEIIKINV